MAANATHRFKQLLDTPEPPGLGPAPRAGVRLAAELEPHLETLFNETGLPSPRRPLVRALILLWHDHLDAAHTLAQQIENADGSLVHAIMHRREPDYWNAKYWWRRVGTHPCFPKLAEEVGAMLKSRGETDLLAALLPRGQWDAAAFVDACEAVAGEPADGAQSQTLREVQRLEFEVALAHLLREEAD